MPSRVSAGLLMYRYRDESLQVFLAHPGGPFFRRKDAGHWTIPKGEQNPGEPLLETAIREFGEEVGLKPGGHFIELGCIRQKGGKTVYAWAFEGDVDETKPIRSNHVEIEWPPGSGRKRRWPEIVQARFYGLTEARDRLKIAQHPLLDRLQESLRLNALKEPTGKSALRCEPVSLAT